MSTTLEWACSAVGGEPRERTDMARLAAFRDRESFETSHVGRGRYRVEQRLGHGGAAAVYRGVEVGTNRKVAIKRLLEDSNPHMASLFELEYHTLASLRHPNIVEVHDYGTDEAGPYYVMELLEGADLNGKIGLPWREIAGYAIEVANALSAIHARKLVHRDVSLRNVWRLPSGHVKLIDFGALASFGVAGQVVGTPPHVAPEALLGRPLDQRTDLYGLGTILYWLLTGAHAYAARSLRELPSLWALPIPSVIERRARSELDDAEPLPAEFDALVMSLISDNPMARPSTTGEVIDLLSALLGIESEKRGPSAVELEQPTLVARERERSDLQRRLEQVRAGRGESTTYVGQRGAGRTRLLLELATDARIFGFSVLHVGAKERAQNHGVAESLLHGLLDALPDLAEQAARPHAAVLAHLSRAMQKRLGVARPRPMPAVAGEARACIHEALSDVFVSVARRAPLALLVDDLECADEASVAWLAEMAERLAREPIWLALGWHERSGSDESYAQRTLRQQSRRVVLKPIVAAETHKLLASLFGEVPHLVRLCERIHRSAQGLPGRIVEVARNLVREGLITNAEGTWVLPQDVPSALLSGNRQEAARLTLARLSPEARALGALLGLRHGAAPLELCKALSPLPAKELFAALEELVREGVLSSSPGGYLFEDELFVALLGKELAQADAEQAHRRLGEFMLARGPASPAEELDALVHLMQGGDRERAPRRVARLGVELAKQDPDKAVEAVPSIERALSLLRGLGKRDADLIGLLGILCVCSYFAERRLAQRYGQAALAAAERSVGIDLIRKATRWLGRSLGLIVGLFLGALRTGLTSEYAPTLPERLELFFNITGSLSGVATICLDGASVERCLRLTEPFAVLGKSNPAGMAHEFLSTLRLTTRDAPAEACARWRGLIATLQDRSKVGRLPEQVRLRFLGGATYALGTLEGLAESPEALELADQLEKFELKLYEMMADQVRTIYYAHQGNRELYERYRSRAELHAIRRGSAWQVETWAPAANIAFAMRSHNAMALKESAEQLRRLEKEIPSVHALAQRARAGYLYQRKRYAEAIPLLQECVNEPPLQTMSWAAMHGMLAGCLNRLGRYAEARQAIMNALALYPPDNLRFTGINLALRTERVVAEAGMGNQERAAQLLDEAFEACAQNAGPLTRGTLNYVRASLALMARDFESCDKYAQETERYYLPTGIPSLVSFCQSFARERRRAQRPLSAVRGGEGALLSDVASDVFDGHSFERELSQTQGDLHMHAERGLNLLTRSLGQVDGGLYVLREEQTFLVAKLGASKLPGGLKAWVHGHLMQAQEDDITCTEVALDGNAPEPDVYVEGAQRFRLFSLSAIIQGRPTVVGAVVFSEAPGTRHFVARELLEVFAQRVLSDLESASVAQLTAAESIGQETLAEPR
jgi:tetratricopeptide (TPR) repeat protein